MEKDLDNSRQQEEITIDDLKIPQKQYLEHQRSMEGGKGWYEVKMTGKLPERRSYQISEVHGDHLYIFGGQDLKEGSYNTLWRLNLKQIMDGGTTAWEQILNQTGAKPKPISHHSGFVHEDTLFVYGGLVDSDSNKDVYMLDLRSMAWSVIDYS